MKVHDFNSQQDPPPEPGKISPSEPGTNSIRAKEKYSSEPVPKSIRTWNKSPSELDPNSIRTKRKSPSEPVGDSPPEPGPNCLQNQEEPSMRTRSKLHQILAKCSISTRKKSPSELSTNLYQNQVQTLSEPRRNIYQNLAKNSIRTRKKICLRTF
ncbi:hypothetical protein AMECASPLE_030181 [Ameca splendens]|uniref:Uncharacterized protein n=1 Tax=Ameca splendens TaxID=208324 RepID=A0ABV0XUZ2_9TELE